MTTAKTNNFNDILSHASGSIPQQIVATAIGLSQLTNNFFQSELSDTCAVYGEMEVCIFCFCVLQITNAVYVCLGHMEYFTDIYNKGIKGENLVIHLSHFFSLAATLSSGFMWISAANVKYLVCVMVVNYPSRSLPAHEYENLNVWVAVLLFTSSIVIGIAKAFHDWVVKQYHLEEGSLTTSSDAPKEDGTKAPVDSEGSYAPLTSNDSAVFAGTVAVNDGTSASAGSPSIDGEHV